MVKVCSSDDFFFDSRAEYRRMGAVEGMGHGWALSSANEEYRLCSSYPRVLCVPMCTSPDVLHGAARFRSKGRIPVVIWRCTRRGLVICRSSQPRVGLTGRRSPEDEQLMRDIAGACGAADVFVFDCRPRVAAYANQAAGAGCEGAGYSLGGMAFGGIPNIHHVRDGLSHLQHRCDQAEVDPRDGSGGSRRVARAAAEVAQGPWMSLVRSILEGAARVAEVIEDEGRPVLVHCSDGWDRTPQICSLAEMMLDPHYRTLDGFLVLVEKEWLSFGHRFGDRCGNTDSVRPLEGLESHRSPIFLQFLWCVMQLLHHQGAAFEFNTRLLWCLRKHHLSCRFGNFLYNREQERVAAKLWESTPSLWSHVRNKRSKYLSRLYRPCNGILFPDWGMGTRVWTHKNPGHGEELVDTVVESLLAERRLMQGEIERLRTEVRMLRARDPSRPDDVVEEAEVSPSTVLITMVPAPPPRWESEVEVVDDYFDRLARGAAEDEKH